MDASRVARSFANVPFHSDLRSWVFSEGAEEAFAEFEKDFLAAASQSDIDSLRLDIAVIDDYIRRRETTRRLAEWQNPRSRKRGWQWQDHVIRFFVRLSDYTKDALEEKEEEEEGSDWEYLRFLIGCPSERFERAMAHVLDIWISHWEESNPSSKRFPVSEAAISEFVDGFESDEEAIAGEVLASVEDAYRRDCDGTRAWPRRPAQRCDITRPDHSDDDSDVFFILIDDDSLADTSDEDDSDLDSSSTAAEHPSYPMQ
ncbi:hypothetical protein NKR23_g245 [Pleurostoma richardsiae]|uniref:Uncharacterized protein n=1 Tax=Pleurostoma richardsiae TaxID=41990 RepID=A0AA38W0G5_9PEZI|nr:hypothetical protein NKR23_g245 [Pleurostoma richardsiae]